MRKILPFHPILIAAFPVLSLFSANLGMFGVADLWRPLAEAVGLAIVVWLLFSLAFRNVHQSATATTVMIVFVVLYGQVFHAPEEIAVVIGWLVIAGSASTVVALKWNGTPILNVLGAFLILSSSGSIVYRTLAAGNPERLGQMPISGRMADATSPDVYYIILDGYGRHDSLVQFIDYSNTDFLNALAKRGFYVANESRSNYVQTEISIPSSLNMNFIPALVKDLDRDDMERVTLDTLAKNNETSRQFKARGYKTAVVTSGFPPFERIPGDEVYREKVDKTLFESTLSQNTPMASTASDKAMYDQRREQLVAAFDNLKRIAGRRSYPRFFFVHILAPHPPFVFDAAGHAIRPNYPFGLWDGSDFEAAGSTREAYKNGYKGQVQTINRMVLNAIDTIQSKPGVAPVIILQGDHGSKRFLDQNSLKDTDVRECFSNLFAICGPPSITSKMYSTISPVNELRLVFDGLFNADFGLLPDRSWYSPYGHPYFFTDVTPQVDAYAKKQDASTPARTVR